jgi:surface antigen
VQNSDNWIEFVESTGYLFENDWGKMKRPTLVFFGLTFATAMTLANPSWAIAAGNFESCIAPTSSRYSCVNFTGYNGYDPYNFYIYGNQAPDGTRHNCLSYVAYRLYYSNGYMPELKNFGDAKNWAGQAVSLLGATLNSTPQVGDIAWWGATSMNANGHVAVVDSVAQNSSGTVTMVKVSDDNAGRMITTVKTLFPGATGSLAYPGTFIRFPSYITNSFGGAGGKPSNPLGSESMFIKTTDQ